MSNQFSSTNTLRNGFQGNYNHNNIPHTWISYRWKNRKDNVIKFFKNKLVQNIIIYLIITAYFLWATIYYFTKNNDTPLWDTRCNGYCFVLIIYCLYFYAFLYNNFLRQFVVPLYVNYIYVPIKREISYCRCAAASFYILLYVAVGAYLIYDTDGQRHRLIPLSGLVIFLLIGFLISANKRQIQWRAVVWGTLLQFVFGFLTIRWEIGRQIINCIAAKVISFLIYALDGAEFVYTSALAKGDGGSLALAFSALTTIFFLSCFINIFYYYGVMQKIVALLGGFLQAVLGTSICESVNCASNIFFGKIESLLVIKPYLRNMTDSEMHTMMLSGFSSVSGSVLAAYFVFGNDIAALITASLMSAPAALCFSKMIYPETEVVKVTKENVKDDEENYESVLDAASRGISDAFQIVSGIVSSLIAFVAFVSFVNGVLGWLGVQVGYTETDWTLYTILGKIFIPLTYLMGVPWDESDAVGKLIGTKLIVNEFVSYTEMQNYSLTDRSKLIATYALCGFSNPASMAIILSSFRTLMPEKAIVVTRLIYRAFIGGALVSFMTACVAGIMTPDALL